MEQLRINQRISLSDGRRAQVHQKLGSGGQGSVFMIDLDGEKKALKWYDKAPSERFITNLQKNIKDGPPSDIFLWPEAMTRRFADGVGYIMPLCPDGYHEFSKFRLAKVRFSSFRAVLTAAIETCEAFRQLHARGLSYQDLNDGGFFINPKTGRVKICDCDNVFPHGDSSGIIGKARYVAPEVVSGKNLPDSYSDRFSMALMIFMFFCIDHPFEGKNVVKYPCLTEDIERRVFGEDLCFIFNPHDNANRPVANVHGNAIRMWALMPKILQRLFIHEFGKDIIDHPQQRMTELEWKEILTFARDELVRCPACGDEVFTDHPCLNPSCMEVPYKKFMRSYLLLKGCNRQIPLVKHSILTLGIHGVDGIVIEHPKDNSMLLLQNLSSSTWKVTTLSGKSLEVLPRGYVPVKLGLQISMTANNRINLFQII